ncbi:VOC family protein [Candidatus Bathyarchaeota archaeon]|nr:VOC family protein [Candidatus Bathyarchaeota archaeon]MBL7167282.1 VOC family protein [Candidatus Bathyarchaeota archaeon]
MEGVVGLVTILTGDLEPMKAFYSDVLGFEVIEDLGNYVEFRNPGVRFAICTREVMYEATGQESYREERGSHAFEIAFPVGDPDDVDRVYDEVVAGGATPIKGPEMMPWGRKTAFIADPDGNIHEIYSYKPEDFS